MIGHKAVSGNRKLMGRAGFAKVGKERVNERAACEQFLSAVRAKRKEVFLEAEVRRRVKAVGRASKIGHGFSGGFGQYHSRGEGGEKRKLGTQRKMAT